MVRATSVALMLLLSAYALAAAAPGLPSFKASYVVRGYGLDLGVYEVTLNHESGGRYVYTSHTHTTGLIAHLYKDRIDERSAGTFQAATPKPLTYTYDRGGGAKERSVRLRFDWAEGTVENQVDGDGWSMEIPAGALDKLAVQLAMMLDLQAGKKDMHYAIADGGKLKTYHFRQIGTERLQTPAGVFDTVKIERLRKDTKRATLLWCAPALHYLPVRIDQREEDDSRFRAALTAFHPAPAAGSR